MTYTYLRASLILLLFLVPEFLIAQQPSTTQAKRERIAPIQKKADRVLNRIPHLKEDTSRANAYHILSTMYADSVEDTVTSRAYFEKATYYARLQLKIALKISWNKGIVNAYSDMGRAYPYAVNGLQAYYWFGKAISVATSQPLKNEAIMEQAEALAYSGKPAEARAIFLSLVPYFVQKKLNRDLRMTYYMLGICGAKQGDFNDLLHFALLSLNTYSATDTSTAHIDQLIGVATAYYIKRDLANSLQALQNAERLIPQNNHYKQSVYIYASLSHIYNGLEDYPKALAVDLKKLALVRSGSVYSLPLALYEVGSDYCSLGKFDKAVQFADEALAAAKNDPDMSYSPYIIKARSSIAKKDYRTALQDANRAVELYQLSPPGQKSKATSSAYKPSVLGEIYLEAPDSVLINAGIPIAERYQLALAIFTKNIEAEKKASLLGESSDYLDISKAYEKLHDEKKALTAYKLYQVNKDTAAKLQDKNELTQKDIQFTYSRQEDSLRYTQLLLNNQFKNRLKLSDQQKNIEALNNQQIAARLQAEQSKRKANDEKLKATQKEQALSKVTLELQDADLRARRSQSYLLMGGIGLMLLLSILIARSYLQQRRSNKMISQTNKLLSERQEEIAAQRDQLSLAITDLKQTQHQLIQAEKMASLGELTAGIAHEIQNPLNFVNNFSEVSVELLDELKEEVQKGDLEEVMAIAGDLSENLSKINHHGKRADGIVKGMLEHSRTSTGRKEPTDLNKLADEYLRLAYHGLRAKDKTFNADLITLFDASLPLANIMPQDMGRVLLNLFNNAFYAVHQKQKNADSSYKPIIEVRTLQVNGQLELMVKDNGNGIPDSIKDKIMQPFFTTKPTGEGTGLGLSLSYDIVVKGHGGSISVNTKENEFTEFIVRVPA